MRKLPLAVLLIAAMLVTTAPPIGAVSNDRNSIDFIRVIETSESGGRPFAAFAFEMPNNFIGECNEGRNGRGEFSRRGSTARFVCTVPIVSQAELFAAMPERVQQSGRFSFVIGSNWEARRINPSGEVTARDEHAALWRRRAPQIREIQSTANDGPRARRSDVRNLFLNSRTGNLEANIVLTCRNDCSLRDMRRTARRLTQDGRDRSSTITSTAVISLFE